MTNPFAGKPGVAGRILLDLTTSYEWRGRKAVGISRTELALALRLLVDPALQVVPFRFKDGILLPFDSQQTHDLLHGVLPLPVPQKRQQWLRPGRLILSLIPTSLRPRAAQALTRLRARWRAALLDQSSRQAGLILQDNDVLFTCGALWEYLDWRTIARLRSRMGVRLVSFVYDIIPVLSTAWNQAPPGHFERHFRNQIDHSDALICISKATQRDVVAFAARQGRPKPVTHVVLLGSEVPAVADPHALPEDLVVRLSKGRFALAVGTFEVRKNYGLLLDVWDRLTLDPDFDLDLVIVGMRGWLAEQVIRRLEESNLFCNRIFWLKDAGDPALAWLYGACHVVLFASLYEGWGLPVVEALQHGRQVIASDRGGVPEAGLGVATIINPDDLDSWCNAVAACAKVPRADLRAVVTPTWDDAAAAVSKILQQFTTSSEAPADRALVPVKPGAVSCDKTKPRGRILFIDHATPTPDQDSGSSDVVGYMKILLVLGYEITLLTAGEAIVADHYTDDLLRLGVVCIGPGVSPEAFVRSHGAGFDMALLYRVNVADRFACLLRGVNPSIKLVFNTVDLHFIREERAAVLLANRAALRQAKATMQRELRVMTQVDATILLSQIEQEAIAALAPQISTWLIPIVRDIPGLLAPLQGRRDVLFVGGFAHAPNVDAILHFSSEIWPQVRVRCPDVRLLVVGSKPTKAVLALDNPQSGIMVLGYVPDLDSLLAGCLLSVAPLRYGAGIKGKVVTSLACGVPCVATSVAVEGMGLTDGMDILIADTPAAYAASIGRLHTDDGLWQSISTAGITFAQQHFSVATVQNRLERLLASLGV